VVHFVHTVKICNIEAKGEPSMLLPVIGYIDKMRTDVNQRNSQNYSPLH